MKIKHLEDIITLGWSGNWGADNERFTAVQKFINNEPNLQIRQEADRLASLYGMGEDCLIDPTYDPKVEGQRSLVKAIKQVKF